VTLERGLPHTALCTLKDIAVFFDTIPIGNKVTWSISLIYSDGATARCICRP